MLMENVARVQTGKVVQEQLEKLGYCCQCVYTNAAAFGVPQSRTRVYIFGALVGKVKFLHGPTQWCHFLEDTLIMWHVLHTVHVMSCTVLLRVEYVSKYVC